MNMKLVIHLLMLMVANCLMEVPPNGQTKENNPEYLENPDSESMDFEEEEGLVSAFSEQVKNQQEEGKVTVCPEAEWVRLKVIKRKWSEPRWTGPYKVTERTSHPVRLRAIEKRDHQSVMPLIYREDPKDGETEDLLVRESARRMIVGDLL
ncbi:hypothetical protein GBF38_022154 [Nibea albiflora]|uniref:Uncharacterized protein n=1 Tax=Nibea albiflora TaxID=240163 RepID=A0ACB7FHN3_NIBAL|nr:hypothetical protein GBF38_022154 [Nibea albiflora]